MFGAHRLLPLLTTRKQRQTLLGPTLPFLLYNIHPKSSSLRPEPLSPVGPKPTYAVPQNIFYLSPSTRLPRATSKHPPPPPAAAYLILRLKVNFTFDP